MPPLVDLSGKKFARLTVLRRDGVLNRKPAWLCRCDCGHEVRVRGGDLRSGRHGSCGCLQRERVTKHGHAPFAGPASPTYRSWVSMIQRCTNPKATGFANYGGRGIAVHAPWRASFATFLADVGERPGLDCSLDRIDLNGNYEPNNCRWVPKSRQPKHRRDVPLHEHDGERL